MIASKPTNEFGSSLTYSAAAMAGYRGAD